MISVIDHGLSFWPCAHLQEERAIPSVNTPFVDSVALELLALSGYYSVCSKSPRQGTRCSMKEGKKNGIGIRQRRTRLP